MEAKRARELTGKATTVTDMGNDAGRFRGNRQPWLELGEAKSEGAGFSFTRAVYHHKVGGWDPRNETGMLNSNMNRVISAEAFTLTSRKPGFPPPFCGLVLHLCVTVSEHVFSWGQQSCRISVLTHRASFHLHNI